MHKDIATAQDIVIKEIYNIFNNALLHGGTAIWRCYKGNRFSDDIDIYIPKKEKKLNNLFKNLEKKGFIIKKKKISKNSLFSVLKFNRIIVRLEALFKKPAPKGILKEYETVEGNLIIINTLSPEEIIKEKIDAYLKRYKIRDLYDIFFLLKEIKNKKTISKNLQRLIINFKKPVNEKELKNLIIEGLVPNTEKMLMYIKRAL